MEKVAKQINEMIKSSDVYVRYINSKELVDKSSDLVKLASEMKRVKDINCKVKNEDLIDEYYRLENEYNSHILVKEYKKNKDELYMLLKEVSDILSFK